ncbi:unnamed protein product [Paramecium primaurelia]|uniref:Uncharacterized protein n=1 Tax=Paramecium primaurelia TaxID=5886 RepID=A0A8S1PLI1_PARPR|nr:unnamed protein product [Paramecium primaurelia]
MQYPGPKPFSFSARNAGEIPKVQSYLMTIFSGTESMISEYEIAANAYNEVFKNINRREEFQMADDGVHSLLPFKKASRGSITNTFQHVLNKLLNNQNQYGKNITIMFIIDRQEEFDVSKLMELIQKVKKEFRIQFLSIAIGYKFPTQICNELWKELHNIDEQQYQIPCLIQRPSDCKTLELQFIKGFQEIRDRYLSFQ